jgi:CubicO group peptidase (beta-lactamase class C family)
LLASIAEEVSKKDFTRLCRQWIFRPLKMKRTDIRTLQQRASEKHFAIGHHYIKEKDQYARADSFLSTNYAIWLGNREGPGRVSSSAADLLRWDKALYTEKLVKPSTLREAFSPMKLNNDSLSRYGFGWGLRQDPVMGKIVHHTGDNPGYKTHILRYIDKHKTIILLSNNAYANFAAIINETEKVLREAE